MNFYRILLSAGSLCYIVPHMMYRDGLSRKIVSGLLVVGIINFALLPITPFENILPIMAGLRRFFLPTCIVWIFFHGWNKNPRFISKQNWIIDSMRDSILVFDPQLELLGSNRVVISDQDMEQDPGLVNSPIPDSAVVSETFLIQIREGIRGGLFDGIISLDQKKYQYRCRSFHTGYLCTLVDLTEEMELVALLQEKNRVLNTQRFLLESFEEQELPIRKIQTESKITGVLNEVVSRSLEKLDKDFQSPTNIREMIQSAESALGYIRKGVSEMREREIE